MPELPEVERGRRLVERVAVGRTIVKVRCARDSIVFEDAGPARMRKALLGRRVLAARRRGKHIWFELDKRPWPTFHFGMTGAFHTPGTKQLKLASSSRRTDDTWPPRFVKIHLWFDDGGELVMTNKRRLGRLRLRDDPPNEPPISELGFDPCSICLRPNDSPSCYQDVARSSKPCCWTSRLPPASGTGSLTRCSIRLESTPGSAHTNLRGTRLIDCAAD